MVGGGPGAGIGPAHRRAAALDGHFQLTAGVFSRDLARNRAMGEELGLVPDRVYPDYAAMAEAESRRPDGIECVSIVTLNDTHAAASLAFIQRRIPVICDKPMATSLRDALEVEKAARRHGVFFALTHNYSAYAMVAEARHLVSSGELGAVRLVAVEYALGHRSRLVEAEGDAKMAWRVQPAVVGPSTVLADIGTHAHHLLRTITRLEVQSLSAELTTIVPGRKVDDNAYVSLRLSGGARAQMWASMVATGNGHGLRIRVFGEKASLHWDQEQPDDLLVRAEGAPYRTLRRGETYLGEAAKRASRARPGNPAGYVEAFANVYTDAAAAIRALQDGQPADPLARSFATARDGVLGMAFIEAAVESDRRNSAWVDIKLQECP